MEFKGKVQEVVGKVKDAFDPLDPERAKQNAGRLSSHNLNRAKQSTDPVTQVIAENEQERRNKPPYEG